MDQLKRYSLVYLATPYTKYPTGIDMAFRDAAVLAAKMVVAGVRVYSPIVYTHQLAIHGGPDPLSHAVWLPFDAPFMDRSEALVIAKMDSWETSFGIAEETRIFRAAQKQIYEICPVTLAVTVRP